MDFSGQSMLPMAAIGAMMMPGAIVKVLATIMLLISASILVVRVRSRRLRGEAQSSYAQLTPLREGRGRDRVA
jgi:hypothetical protein